MKTIVAALVVLLLAQTAYSQNWKLTNGPASNYVSSVQFDGQKNIYVLSNLLFKTTDHGASWNQVLPNRPGAQIINFTVGRDNNIYMLVDFNNLGVTEDTASLIRSTDGGATWNTMIQGEFQPNILVGPDSTVYAFTVDSAFVSRDYGISWSKYSLVQQMVINDAAIDSNGIPILATNGGLFRSTDKGKSWPRCVNGLLGDGFKIVTCGKGGQIYGLAENESFPVYHSSDDGRTWEDIPIGGEYISKMSTNPQGRVFIFGKGNVYYTDFIDTSWKQVVLSANLAESMSEIQTPLNLLTSDDDSGFYSGGYERLFHINGIDNSAWQTVDVPISSVPSVASTSNGVLIASHIPSGNERYTNGMTSLIWRSTDQGSTWTFLRDTTVHRDTIFQDNAVTGKIDTIIRVYTTGDPVWLNPFSFAVDSNHNLLGCGIDYSAYHTTDDGLTWESISSPLSGGSRSIIVAPNSNIFLGSSTDGVFRSTDGGFTWDQLNYGLNSLGVYTLAVGQLNDLYAGVDSEIYKSTDNGNSWQYLTVFPFVSMQPPIVTALVVSLQGNVIAGVSGSGMYQSTDNGTTWVPLGSGLPTTTINCLLVTPSGIVFAGTDSGVYQLNVGATTWQPYNLGLTTTNVLSLTRDPAGRIYAGTDGCGVFVSLQTFNKIQQSVEPTEVASNLTITPPYPNPSRSSSTFGFTNTMPMHLTIELVDITGRVMKHILNEDITTGDHSMSLDLTNYSSGYYGLRFTSASETQTFPVVINK